VKEKLGDRFEGFNEIIVNEVCQTVVRYWRKVRVILFFPSDLANIYPSFRKREERKREREAECFILDEFIAHSSYNSYKESSLRLSVF